MKRVIQVCAGIAVLAVWWTVPAFALSKEEIYKRCIENLKEEFGEASVEFEKFRRNGNREMAFGRLEMTDGTTRQIRCRVRHGRAIDVNFRSNGSGNDAWSRDRPENAGFIEAEKTEPDPTATEKPAETTQEQEPNGPRRVTIPGRELPNDTETAAADPESTETPAEQPQEPQNADPDAAAGQPESETPDNQTTETSENAEQEIERKPRFIKVPTK